ncbi:MAG: hypothetical protein LBL86_08440 [Coriobacteriales bacterium]|jgi:hypothetical protein|nr:hypothetical protein [Coriobacteriales bacterium]
MDMLDSYIIIYGFLGDYAEITKNLDVDSIVSEMTPMVYGSPDDPIGYSSFDPAVYEEDWVGSWAQIVGKGKRASTRQVFQVARELLKYYEQELGYDLDDAEEFLKERLGVLPLTGRKDWAIRLSA